jgi:hypothetical protein
MRHNLERNSSGSAPSVISSLNTHRFPANTSLRSVWSNCLRVIFVNTAPKPNGTMDLPMKR